MLQDDFHKYYLTVTSGFQHARAHAALLHELAVKKWHCRIIDIGLKIDTMLPHNQNAVNTQQ